MAILNWLEEQKSTAAIEEVVIIHTILRSFPLLLLDTPDVQVNSVLLDRLVLEEEYVAVLFLGECEGEEKVPSTSFPSL